MPPKTTIATFENGVKFATLILSLSGFYFKMISDIRNIETEKRFEIEHLQYQITELKRCCNGTNENKIVYNHHDAILPNNIELKNE